ncbi:MAG TPA: hypothetical protein VJ045_03795, partial [Hyphomicrobiaceae bacterium]|nr:hypothetical protein [Hyphomicrobiaceae bacterium]
MMRRVGLTALLLWMLFATSAAAQRTYTWDEVCRDIGMTTGPCAPKSEREKPMGCVKISGNAFHAEKSPSGCIQTTLAPG